MLIIAVFGLSGKPVAKKMALNDNSVSVVKWKFNSFLTKKKDAGFRKKRRHLNKLL